jgi:hypothetical protein
MAFRIFGPTLRMAPVGPSGSYATATAQSSSEEWQVWVDPAKVRTIGCYGRRYHDNLPKGERTMVILHAHVSIKPEARDRWFALLDGVTPPSRADDACQSYVLYEAPRTSHPRPCGWGSTSGVSPARLRDP